MIHLGDITKIDWSTVPPVDCVTGGSPCQDLSVAGKRAGLAGERSGLYMEQIKCVKELRKADERRGRTAQFIRPRYMVWENVPGSFSSNGGEDFRAVLEEAAKIADETAVIPRPSGKWSNSGAVMGDGWSLAWRVHDAQFWGVPQRRRRISLVCDFAGQSAPEILFERKSVSWNPQESGAPGEEAAGGTGKSVESAISFQERAGKPGGGKGILIQNERTGALSTLNNQMVYDARGNGDGKTVCTITGDHQNRVMDYTALCIGNGQTNNISMKPIANTLDTLDDVQKVLISKNTMHDQQAVLAYGASSFGTYSNQIGTIRAQGGGIENLSIQNSVVRRLTPLEAERLQGYPDGWTDIGEWVDSKGKKHKPADSPRYKALGNSIALPFWFWLLRRISAQYYRPATLGSLFDGIGGFPLCWERCNGQGTALWASEIEEFPIAVTKKRFGD